MEQTKLRVASYNIKSLQISRDDVIRTLRELDADVVALQEVPRKFRQRAKLHAMAKEAGYTVVVAGGYPIGAVTCAILAQAGVAAGVVTSGHKVLPFDVLRWRGYWRRHGLNWPSRRGFAYADFGEFVFFSIHLGLAREERAWHRNIILHAIKDAGKHRTIVAGDINEGAEESSWDAFRRPLRDAFAEALPHPDTRECATFPTRKPRRRIDAVFVGDIFDVRSARVHHSEAAQLGSDHLPIVVELAF